MLVAALYDVHGNLPALEAVLADVEREPVDHIVFGGDLAAGPLPRETIDLARSLDAIYVRGNADRDPVPWVKEKLNDEQLEWLAALDFSATVNGTLYVHATPGDDETVVTELTTDEQMAEILGSIEQSRVVAGHTHMQLVREVGAVTFVNAGSVGMPYEAERGAYWALIGETVELRRSEYDYERAAAAIRASGYPQAEELASENVLSVPSRAEALAVFGG